MAAGGALRPSSALASLCHACTRGGGGGGERRDRWRPGPMTGGRVTPRRPRRRTHRPPQAPTAAAPGRVAAAAAAAAAGRRPGPSACRRTCGRTCAARRPRCPCGGAVCRQPPRRCQLIRTLGSMKGCRRCGEVPEGAPKKPRP